MNELDINKKFSTSLDDSRELSTWLLIDIVSHRCDVAIASSRKFGSAEADYEEGAFYQIMSSHEFFDWYCDIRPYHQFFLNPEIAALFYARYFFVWERQNIQ